MDQFRLFFATSGRTERPKPYCWLLFSQSCVCYFLNIGLGPKNVNGLAICSKNKFREYHGWNRIENPRSKHYTNFQILLKLCEKPPTCFKTLTFCRNLGFQKSWICSWIFQEFPTHGFPTHGFLEFSMSLMHA